MFNFLNPQYRYITSRHNIPYARADVQGEVPVTSVVIPCTGADFIEEAELSALFAARYATQAEEIVIVSDQPAELFRQLPEKPVWSRWMCRSVKKITAISKSTAAA